MSKAESISVRLDEDVRRQLEEISRQSGIKVSDIIRRATVDYVRKLTTDGAIKFELDIGKIIKKAGPPNMR